jgi:chromate transporter
VSWVQFLLAGLRLGVVGFGGGLAVLTLIRREFVERRHVITEAEFAEIAGAAQALPGAVSVNAFTILGTRVSGWLAGLVAGWGFVIPSFILMVVLAATYPAFRYLPYADSILAGMTAGVVALVVLTGVDLARAGAIRRRCEAALALGALAGVALHWIGVLEVVLLAGLVGLVCGAPEWRKASLALAPPSLFKFFLGGATLGTVASLGGVFLRIGAATFGGGFVMIPFIEQEVVLHHQWIRPVEFADAMALGQVTPGPVVISAAFIGHRVAGLIGASVATAAVFLPPGLLAMAAGHALDRFGKNPVVSGFLAGVRPAVVGLLGGAALSLGRAGLHDLSGWGIAAVGLLVGVRWRLHPLLVLALCAVLHLGFHEGFAALFG